MCTKLEKKKISTEEDEDNDDEEEEDGDDEEEEDGEDEDGEEEENQQRYDFRQRKTVVRYQAPLDGTVSVQMNHFSY